MANCHPKNVVGIDTRGRHEDVVSEIDSKRVSFEASSYCLRLLDDASRRANLEMHKEVESAPHRSELAEGASCIVQHRRLRDREGLSKWSGG